MTQKDVIRETDADAVRLARTLMRAARYGALAALVPADGAPLASRVAVATDIDGAPVILVSALSAHTGALAADPRCSLLVGEPGKGDPLAHPRISLACRAAKLEPGTPSHARAERRYLNRHPKAKLYSGFGDFSFFRLEPAAASLNGGFARAYRLTASEILCDRPVSEALAYVEQDAVTHMNADHAATVDGYARRFAGAREGGWTVTGMDPDGFDIARGDAVRRVFFSAPLINAEDLKKTLQDMASRNPD